MIYMRRCCIIIAFPPPPHAQRNITHHSNTYSPSHLVDGLARQGLEEKEAAERRQQLLPHVRVEGVQVLLLPVLGLRQDLAHLRHLLAEHHGHVLGSLAVGILFRFGVGGSRGGSLLARRGGSGHCSVDCC